MAHFFKFLISACLLVGFLNIERVETAGAESTSTTAASTTAASMTNSSTTSGASKSMAAAATTKASSNVTATAQPTVSTAAKKVKAEIKLNVDFDTISAPDKKKQFEADMTKSMAKSLGVKESQIEGMTATAGSVILSFTIVTDTASGAAAVSPATALATLKTQVKSGSLSVKSDLVPEIKVDTTYFKAVEPGLTCYSCSGDDCGNAQTDKSPTKDCALNQACWTQSKPEVLRKCDVICPTTHKDKMYCTTVSGKETCSKCCATAKCNKDSTSGASNLAVTAPLLLSLAALFGFLM